MNEKLPVARILVALALIAGVLGNAMASKPF
jgi:hypothetical protein